jgi:ribosome maturation factor RimP
MELSTLKSLIAPQVIGMGYFLYDIEYVKEGKDHILRVMIDKTEGIVIDDCIAVSEVLNPLLDQWDPISEEYSLEVSSPGAERKLRTPEEITRAIGKFVHVETFEQKMEGKLEAFQNDVLTLKIRNKKIDIATPDITLIRIAIKM